MTGSTPNGLPYPTAADAVADYPAVAQDLATKIRIASGRLTFPTGSGEQSVAVTFPAGLFTTSQIGIALTASSSYITTGAVSIGGSGFTARGSYRSTPGDVAAMPAGVNAGWVAIQL